MSAPDTEPRAALRLFRGRALEIDVHASLIIVAVVVAVVMAMSLLPGEHGDRGYSSLDFWLLGMGCGALMLVSVALHEVAHAVAERLRGRPVRRISLVFLHTGHAPLPEPGTTPWGELLVAVAGPIVTLAVGFGALGGQALAGTHRFAGPLFEFVAITNLLFAAVQLIPGHPLDGGRALRAVAWGLAGDPFVGTRWACRLTLAFAIVLGVACAGALPFTGIVSMPLWGCLMALVLGMQSVAIARLARTRERLGGLCVAHVMEPTPDAVPRIVSVADALATAALRGVSAFLVEFQGRLGGIVTTAALEGVPGEERPQTPVGQVTRRLERQHLLQPTMALDRAFQRMAEERLPLLPVLSDGQLVGVIRQEAIARVLRGGTAS